VRLRLRRPRQLARDLLAAARRDHEEVADYLETHGEEWEALAEAAPGDAADVLEQLTEEDAAGLLAELEPEDVADILEQISPELLYELDDEVSEGVLALLDDESEQEIRRLLEYPSDTAGGLMTTEIAALPIGLTAGEAIERIRQLHDEYEDFSYVYVVDDDSRLRGVIYFRDLVFARPGASLDEVMVPDPVAVEAMTDREEVAELAQRYRLFGIPVIDEDGLLLGVVTTDAVIEAIQDEATEDFAAAVGAGLGETVYTDVTKSFRSRAPWLVLNLTLALAVAYVIENQTGVIASEPVLAALMPIVATLGGNGGNQSLAVMIRSLASDDVPRAQVPSILVRQAGVGLLNGLLLAFAATILTFVLVDSGVFESNSAPIEVAFVVGLACLANLLIATLAGTAIPLILRRLGLDPALASSILLTMITDLVGFGGFLLVAAALL
jgi:magnesium transporter